MHSLKFLILVSTYLSEVFRSMSLSYFVYFHDVVNLYSCLHKKLYEAELTYLLTYSMEQSPS